MTDLAFAGAAELARRIKNKEVGCVELLTYYLERVDRFNPDLNAIVVDIRDEALARAVFDVSGRAHLEFDADFSRSSVGDFSTEMVREFFGALVHHGRVTLHVALLSGVNAHHQVEAVFKAAARALRQAVAMDERVSGVPSTKGSL